ncbi:MAG: hypothetical protein IKR49_02375 [Clostridia bacterium]|nr:hypothetical protein [Clostridia bacterium]
MKKVQEKPYRDRDLDRAKPIERAVLRTYYDTDLSWEQVADALHYSVSRIYQLRRAALERIYSIDRNTKAE